MREHPESENRCKRVTAYTIALARATGMSREEIKTIARGAFLLDIGRMTVTDSISLLPDPLTEGETAAIEEYCYAGYRILLQNPQFRESAEIVYAQDERYDGQGFPRGLKGDEIPMGARLVAVAKTLDSLIFNPLSDPAKALQGARNEIENWSGRRFDPTIVRVFLDLPDHLWTDLRNETNDLFPSC